MPLRDFRLTGRTSRLLEHAIEISLSERKRVCVMCPNPQRAKDTFVRCMRMLERRKIGFNAKHTVRRIFLNESYDNYISFVHTENNNDWDWRQVKLRGVADTVLVDPECVELRFPHLAEILLGYSMPRTTLQELRELYEGQENQ